MKLAQLLGVLDAENKIGTVAYAIGGITNFPSAIIALDEALNKEPPRLPSSDYSNVPLLSLGPSHPTHPSFPGFPPHAQT